MKIDLFRWILLLYEMYRSYVKAGFTAKQSIELVKEVLRTCIAPVR